MPEAWKPDDDEDPSEALAREFLKILRKYGDKAIVDLPGIEPPDHPPYPVPTPEQIREATLNYHRDRLLPIAAQIYGQAYRDGISVDMAARQACELERVLKEKLRNIDGMETDGMPL